MNPRLAKRAAYGLLAAYGWVAIASLFWCIGTMHMDLFRPPFLTWVYLAIHFERMLWFPPRLWLWPTWPLLWFFLSAAIPSAMYGAFVWRWWMKRRAERQAETDKDPIFGWTKFERDNKALSANGIQIRKF